MESILIDLEGVNSVLGVYLPRQAVAGPPAVHCTIKRLCSYFKLLMMLPTVHNLSGHHSKTFQ